jgi:hypothetical protein
MNIEPGSHVIKYYINFKKIFELKIISTAYNNYPYISNDEACIGLLTHCCLVNRSCYTVVYYGIQRPQWMPEIWIVMNPEPDTHWVSLYLYTQMWYLPNFN